MMMPAVTFTINRMSGGTAMIYAVTCNTADFDKVAGKEIVPVKEGDAIDLSGEAWNLILHSYGPDPDSGDPGDSQITDVDFGMLSLGKWPDIQATKEQLDKLGVHDMKGEPMPSTAVIRTTEWNMVWERG